jgi:methionyl-tRNA formyltransferase
MIIVAFRILPEVLYSKAKKGAVNLHGSLLPKYRGAAPINWAIINGESKTGVTTFFLKKKVDTGNIIARREIVITPDMTAGELHDIMAMAGADLLVETIRMIEKDAVRLLEQDETQVSQAPKIFPEDCRIDFNKPALQVHNFIRGLTPHPGAYSYLNGRRVRLAGTQVLEGKQTDKPPGTIAVREDNQALWVSCKPGMIAVREIKAEGKRQMHVADFLRGHPLKPGARFEAGQDKK